MFTFIRAIDWHQVFWHPTIGRREKKFSSAVCRRQENSMAIDRTRQIKHFCFLFHCSISNGSEDILFNNLLEIRFSSHYTASICLDPVNEVAIDTSHPYKHFCFIFYYSISNCSQVIKVQNLIDIRFLSHYTATISANTENRREIDKSKRDKQTCFYFTILPIPIQMLLCFKANCYQILIA